MPHKKGHTWKDAFGGQLINKGKLWIKSDKNPLQEMRSNQAGIANKKTASGRIQSKLVDAGHQRADLRRLTEKTKAAKQKRADMQKLRKTNPEKYKKLKKEQRKKEREAAFAKRGNSSTWD